MVDGDVDAECAVLRTRATPRRPGAPRRRSRRARWAPARRRGRRRRPRSPPPRVDRCAAGRRRSSPGSRAASTRRAAAAGSTTSAWSLGLRCRVDVEVAQVQVAARARWCSRVPNGPGPSTRRAVVRAPPSPAGGTSAPPSPRASSARAGRERVPRPAGLRSLRRDRGGRCRSGRARAARRPRRLPAPPCRVGSYGQRDDALRGTGASLPVAERRTALRGKSSRESDRIRPMLVRRRSTAGVP